MLSVNSSPVAQQQNTVAFRGKAPNLRNLSKTTLDSYKAFKKSKAELSEHKLLWFFANIKSSISSWFRDLKIMLKNPKDFIEYNPFKNKKIDYSKAHSVDAGKKGAEFAANNGTKALMEFHEALAKKFLKK